MQFYEKLIFVMNLTQTTNRELALAAQVDPSIISRFRSGKRGIPRNPEPLRSMADFLPDAVPANIREGLFQRWRE